MEDIILFDFSKGNTMEFSAHVVDSTLYPEESVITMYLSTTDMRPKVNDRIRVKDGDRNCNRIYNVKQLLQDKNSSCVVLGSYFGEDCDA